MQNLNVCIPTYNGAKYIRECLQSVLSQANIQYKLLLSDDFSTDGTRDILRDFVITNPEIQLSTNSSRLGLVKNWNKCVEMSGNKFLCIFHQDDVMCPDNLSRKIRVLEDNPQVGYVFSNIITMDENGKMIGGHWNPILPNQDMIFKGTDFFRLLLKEGNLVPCQTVVIRQSLLAGNKLFDDRLVYTPDLEMWLRLALYSDVAYLCQPLVKLRRHDKQESVRFFNTDKEINEVWNAFKIVLSEQKDHISDIDGAYMTALSHLESWIWMSFKGSLKQFELFSAASLLRKLLQVSRLKRLGFRAFHSNIEI